MPQLSADITITDAVPRTLSPHDSNVGNQVPIFFERGRGQLHGTLLGHHSPIHCSLSNRDNPIHLQAILRSLLFLLEHGVDMVVHELRRQAGQDVPGPSFRGG